MEWKRGRGRRSRSRNTKSRIGLRKNKSYHVVGHWKNFFGGYYHSKGYGFGHWSYHDKMPGQKLWLWALSDEGKIWESHLTDSDGQYIEFQAGRQLVQFSPNYITFHIKFLAQ